ncbi:MAG: hypothetical protein WAM75_18695 [Xanthobacteraceae bacterium]
MVTRHILEQTRRNGDDMAAVKARLNRVEEKVDGLDRKVDGLAQEVGGVMGAKVARLERSESRDQHSG